MRVKWSIYISNINRTDTEHSGSLAHGGDLPGHTLRLVDIATDDAGVSSQVDHSLGLDTTYRASSSRYEDDLVVCTKRRRLVSSAERKEVTSVGITENSIPPYTTQELRSVDGHGFLNVRTEVLRESSGTVSTTRYNRERIPRWARDLQQFRDHN